MEQNKWSCEGKEILTNVVVYKIPSSTIAQNLDQFVGPQRMSKK